MGRSKGTKPSGFSSEITDDSRNPPGIGTRVKTARNRAGLSQADLASLIGVSSTTIQNYEAGQFPKGELAVQLAERLGCSLDWLLAGKEAAPLLPAGDQACPNCSRLQAELAQERGQNRELVNENRQLWKENGDLRVEVEQLKARAAPTPETSEDARKTA